MADKEVGYADGNGWPGVVSIGVQRTGAEWIGRPGEEGQGWDGIGVAWSAREWKDMAGGEFNGGDRKATEVTGLAGKHRLVGYRRGGKSRRPKQRGKRNE